MNGDLIDVSAIIGRAFQRDKHAVRILREVGSEGVGTQKSITALVTLRCCRSFLLPCQRVPQGFAQAVGIAG